MDRPATTAIELPESFPLLLVVSGPSGVGKDAVLKQTRDLDPSLHLLVTCTTRAKREEEKDGVDYHFLTEEDFREKIGREQFLEWSQVYGRPYYGSLRTEVQGAFERGQDVIMRVDIQGVKKIKKTVRDAIFVMLLPPSLESLKARLLKRHGTWGEDLQKRLDAAAAEMAEADKFDYVVVNGDGDLKETGQRVLAILQAEKLRYKPRHVTL